MKDYFILGPHKTIKEAQKDVYLDNSLISEWAIAVAMSAFTVGQRVSHDEFQQQVAKAVFQQQLDVLVEEGDLVMSWDSNDNKIGYHITEQGKEKTEYS